MKQQYSIATIRKLQQFDKQPYHTQAVIYKQILQCIRPRLTRIILFHRCILLGPKQLNRTRIIISRVMLLGCKQGHTKAIIRSMLQDSKQDHTRVVVIRFIEHPEEHIRSTISRRIMQGSKPTVCTRISSGERDIHQTIRLTGMLRWQRGMSLFVDS